VSHKARSIPREVSIAKVEEKEVKMEPFHPEVLESLAERAKKMILKTSNPAIIT